MIDGERREAKKAEAGDEYGDAGKSGKEGTLLLFCFIELVEAFVEEGILEWDFGEVAFPGLLQVVQGAGDFAAGLGGLYRRARVVPFAGNEPFEAVLGIG